MEGEVYNLILVWIAAVTSLCYCYFIIPVATAGPKRLLSISPVILLFLLLPLNLTTISIGGLSTFFLAWLANFKLLLLAFGKGPISSPDLSLPHFIASACLPIKLQISGAGKCLVLSAQLHEERRDPSDCSDASVRDPHVHRSGDYLAAAQQLAGARLEPQFNEPYLSTSLQISGTGGLKSPINYAAKCLVLAALFPLYMKKDEIHLTVLTLAYAIHMYIGLEIALAAFGAATQHLAGAQLEPQFNEPYLSTSLQDFWGRRWNLMVTSILRPSVYDPVRAVSVRWIGKRWAALPAVFSTFVVSGLMHELIFWYIGRKKPAWMVTCFFILHGVSVGVEILLKKAVRWRLPAVVSCPLTVAYVAVTALWLFFPELMRCDAEVKAWRETVAVVEFFKGIWLHP